MVNTRAIEELIRFKVAKEDAAARERVKSGFNDIVDTTEGQEEVEVVAYDTVAQDMKGFFIVPNWEETILKEAVLSMISEGRAILTEDTVFVRDLLEWRKEVGLRYNKVSENTSVRVFPARSVEEVKDNFAEIQEMKMLIAGRKTLKKDTALLLTDKIEILSLQSAFATNDEAEFRGNLEQIKSRAYIAVLMSGNLDCKNILERLNFVETRLEESIAYLRSEQGVIG